MTLPDPDIPLVYSLRYFQQGCQYWKDELLAETVGLMKQQDEGKSNLHAEEDFSEKLESMNLDPRLSKLIQEYQECFGALLPPLLAHATCTLFCASNAQRDTGSQQCKKTIFLDIS